MVEREEARREKSVYFIQTGTQEELRRYLKGFCDKLLGSDVFVSRKEGDIYFITWRDLPKERILPLKYIQISKTGPRADIYAQYTRYTETKNMVVKQIRKNDGSVEAGIRAFDHILEGVRGKETQQAMAVEGRASEVLDLFRSRNLTDITEKEFKQAEAATYKMLQKNELDPTKLVNKIKRDMTSWLLKGETGKDSIERYNWLISVCALQAAYRTAVERKFGLGPIAVKYVEGREALFVTREFCRSVFREVVDELRPEALPASVIFRYPEKKNVSRQVAYVSGMLGTAAHQLSRFIPLKPYKPVASEAATLITLAQGAVKERKIAEAKRLLAQARLKLVEQLEKSKYIYPPSK